MKILTKKGRCNKVSSKINLYGHGKSCLEPSNQNSAISLLSFSLMYEIGLEVYMLDNDSPMTA